MFKANNKQVRIGSRFTDTLKEKVITTSLLESTTQWILEKAPNQPEYLQAIEEVCEYIVPIVNANESYKANNVLERIILPQQVTEFSIEWENDQHECEVNLGWRVQHNNTLGPYKGGTRFHPNLNQSILKFLAFEQTFKNALTGLSLGAGKGGSDFNPKGRSEREIIRFCKAYMRELSSQIGSNQDVPAGDINVSDQEIGYMFGEYLKQTQQYEGALSGKPLSLGGSEMRVPATGFGVIYFIQNMLNEENQELAGKTIAISGAGNVALHAAMKAINEGAKVLTLSNSRGGLLCEDGLALEHINWLLNEGKDKENALQALAQKFDLSYSSSQSPWDNKVDIAIPCATQNEIDENAAKKLVDNVSFAVVEGANMPCTAKASKLLLDSDLLYAPGKAANAGGVVLSAFEMQQNAAMKFESTEALDKRLKETMQHIHQQCVQEGRSTSTDKISYMKGANIAGFRRLADAMVARGF